MKKILSISSVFIGLVIGAGFASGREIFEYFNLPSRTDPTGIALATLGFGLICYITMALAQREGYSTFDEMITGLSGRLSPFFRILMSLFMFCGFFVMLSGCGVLAEENVGVSPQLGIWLLAALCFVVFSYNIKGLVIVNTLLVPLMTAGMIFLCLSSALTPLPTFGILGYIKSNPIGSALCYVSYNTITAGAVLIPLSVNTTKKEITSAAILSGAVLGVLIFLARTTMNLFFDSLTASEMPLLSLAELQGKSVKVLYSFVLFAALCTTAVSQGFGILSKFKFRSNSHRILSAAALCLFAIPFAGLGFSNLVAKLYFVFGLLGILWTALLLWKYLKSR